MKVLLINPPRNNSVWCGVPDIFNGKDQHLFPPLGIMSLSGYLKERTDHEVHILDPNAEDPSYEALEKSVRSFGPDVVGINALTHNVVDVNRTANLAKKVNPDAHVIVGGPHVTEFTEESLALRGVDTGIYSSDAEETLAEWLDVLVKGKGHDEVKGVAWKDPQDGSYHKNAFRPINKNIDGLPFPDRTGLDLAKYYTPGMRSARATTMVTSRGCPQTCHFCLANRSYRVRTATNVVDEMEACARMGIGEIHFVDDIFNAPTKRVVGIADEILQRGFKVDWGFKAIVNATTYDMLKRAREAGCVKAHFGVETGTEDGLKSLGKTFIDLDQSRRAFKWCRELGIKSVAYIMIGIPAEKTAADIMKTVKFIHEIDPDFVVYALMSPYPHTPLWEEGAKLGLWDIDLWKKFMIDPQELFELPTVWTQHMSKEELVRIFKHVNHDFYFNPRKVFKTLLDVHSVEELKRIVRGGLVLLKLSFLRAQGQSI